MDCIDSWNKVNIGWEIQIFLYQNNFFDIANYNRTACAAEKRQLAGTRKQSLSEFYMNLWNK